MMIVITCLVLIKIVADGDNAGIDNNNGDDYDDDDGNAVDDDDDDDVLLRSSLPSAELLWIVS